MGQADDGDRGSPGRCNLADFRQLGSLPHETVSELERICRPRSFRAGQIVASGGDNPDFVGFVAEGILRMQKTLHDGRQHIVGLLVDDDMFGRSADLPLEYSVEAATDAEVLTFRRAPFEALLQQCPELDRLVLQRILNELDRARDWMIILANPHVRGRLAGFLMMLCTRYPTIDHVLRIGRSSVTIKVPISRTDLAHLLGTRTESISRALHALAADGSIVIRRPDVIEVRDLVALAAETGDQDWANTASWQQMVSALRSKP